METDLKFPVSGEYRSFKQKRRYKTKDWFHYISFLEKNYPNLKSFNETTPSLDSNLIYDEEICNKIDVLYYLDQYNSPDMIWKGIKIAVCKMGYFGKYSRFALGIEESNLNYVLTFNEFMHIYPFLREINNNSISSFDTSSTFKDYISENLNLNYKQTNEYINSKSTFTNLIESWENVLNTPLFTCNFNCTIYSCPAITQISIDPIHELVFIKYLNNHYNCSENHKRKIYDIVKKSFVRFGGDLEYVNSLYVDMPRRYGIGFVESSLSNIFDKKKNETILVTSLSGSTQISSTNSSANLSSSTWASTLKRRTMYDIQSKPKLNNYPTTNTTIKTTHTNLENQPEWKVHISKNAKGDLIEIYKLWREKYFKRQDFMWDSLSNCNWFEDFNLVKRYWEMAQLNGVKFIDNSKSLIIPKDSQELNESNIWIIIEDDSISSLIPLPKDLQNLNGLNWKPNMTAIESAIFNQEKLNRDQFNEVGVGIENSGNNGINLPGVMTIKRCSLTSYDKNLKLFRIINGKNGKVAGFIICERKTIWENIKELIPQNNSELLERIVLSSTPIEIGKPSNIKLFIIDFINSSGSNSNLNSFFPPDIIRELNFSIISGEFKFNKVKELIKSKSPRQRSHSIEPLVEPIQISSPFIQVGSNVNIVRVANLTGTVRVSIKSMFKCLEDIELGIQRDDDTEEGLVGDFKKSLKWAREKRQLDLIKGEVNLKYLKLIWLYEFQCNGNSIGVNKKIGFGDDLDSIKIGPKLQLQGKGLLGLVSTLLKWKQEV